MSRWVTERLAAANLGSLLRPRFLRARERYRLGLPPRRLPSRRHVSIRDTVRSKIRTCELFLLNGATKAEERPARSSPGRRRATRAGAVASTRRRGLSAHLSRGRTGSNVTRPYSLAHRWRTPHALCHARPQPLISLSTHDLSPRYTCSVVPHARTLRTSV